MPRFGSAHEAVHYIKTFTANRTRSPASAYGCLATAILRRAFLQYALLNACSQQVIPLELSMFCIFVPPVTTGMAYKPPPTIGGLTARFRIDI